MIEFQNSKWSILIDNFLKILNEFLKIRLIFSILSKSENANFFVKA